MQYGHTTDPRSCTARCSASSDASQACRFRRSRLSWSRLMARLVRSLWILRVPMPQAFHVDGAQAGGAPTQPPGRRGATSQVPTALHQTPPPTALHVADNCQVDPVDDGAASGGVRGGGLEDDAADCPVPTRAGTSRSVVARATPAQVEAAMRQDIRPAQSPHPARDGRGLVAFAATAGYLALILTRFLSRGRCVHTEHCSNTQHRIHDIWAASAEGLIRRWAARRSR